MAAEGLLMSAVGLLIVFSINALMIYVAMSFVSKKVDFAKSIMAAIAAVIVFTIIPPVRMITLILGFFFWLLILKELFDVSWGKALVGTVLIIVVNVLFFLVFGLAELAIFSMLNWSGVP